MSGQSLPTTIPLSEFRERTGGDHELSRETRGQIIAAARELLEQFYVHLNRKRERYGVEPLDELRELEALIEKKELADVEFHTRMLEIFAGLRDRHTIYWVPSPYRDQVAVLPFRVQRAEDRYWVTELVEDWIDASQRQEPAFATGVEVVGWNDESIQAVVERNAEWQGGTNEAARIARSVANLTDRPLTFSPLPDKDSVRVTFRGRKGEEATIDFDWRVLSTSSAPDAGDRLAATTRAAYRIAVDRPIEAIRRAQKTRFRPDEIARERPELPDPPLGERMRRTILPDNLQYTSVPEDGRQYGHLRIRSFDVTETTQFSREIRRLIRENRPSGLIIDVRGNGGGQLAAAERLLQVFTPLRIEPGGIQFRVTDGTRAVLEQKEFERWSPSELRTTEDGDVWSEALPLEPGYVEECNGIGQRYYGPVVLIVDALSYSATDAFAAGFQDHEIGEVIGVDGATGGGGGNPWSIRAIAEKSGRVPSWPLPSGASFDIAVRRNLRVRAHSGEPIEDEGVTPKEVIGLTVDDLLHGNRDLLSAAIGILKRQPLRKLEVDLSFQDGVVELELDAAGIDKFEVHLDGGPVGAGKPVPITADAIRVDADADTSHLVEINGFTGGKQVAAWRERIGTGRATPVAPGSPPPETEAE